MSGARSRPSAALIGLALFAALGMAQVLAAAAPSPTPTAKQPDSQVCVNVQIGNDSSQYFNCLNAQMSREVADQANQQAVLQTAVSNSQPQSPTQMGLFNQTATQERLGSAFGHSVVPERPVPHFTNPLIH